MHISKYIIMLANIIKDSQFFIKTTKSVILLIIIILLSYFANALSIN